MSTLSLTMMVRNEETNLAPCLATVRDLVDVIVIVDTGSTDRTIEIAKSFGAKVVSFPWCDSFAAARNEAFKYATGGWIFWMDADDRLDEPNRVRLARLKASLGDENAAYVVKCLCVPSAPGGAATVVDHVRLFRNDPRLRWKYRVHEQILPALREIGAEVRPCDVVIHHVGYQDPSLRRQKLARDLRLVQMELAEQPDEPFVLFNLGSILLDLGHPGEALDALRRSLALSHPGDSIVRKLYVLAAYAHRQLGHPLEALAVCHLGRNYYPADSELLLLEAELRLDRCEHRTAENLLIHLLNHQDVPAFASVNPAIYGTRPRQMLAELYLAQGRLSEAEAQWRSLLESDPQSMPALIRLGELLLQQERHGGVEQVAQSLEGLPGGQVEANFLRAKAHLARQEFAAALTLVEASLPLAPAMVELRTLKSHVLLQEARDWPAAAQALRDVLALDPNNASARHNLDLLVRQHAG